MTDIEKTAAGLTPNMVKALTSWCHDDVVSQEVDDATRRALVTRKLGAWYRSSVKLTVLGCMVRDVLLAQQETERLIAARTVEFARMCSLDLDAEEDPVAAGDVKRAAADDVALRAGIKYAPEVLPSVLANYLARSWQMHADAFDRVEMLSELEIAARWARSHATAARDLLTMRSDPEGES